MMKGLRLVMNGSLVLNSTRLARFWTALATSFRVRDEDSDGLPVHDNNIIIIHAHVYIIIARIEYMTSDIWLNYGFFRCFPLPSIKKLKGLFQPAMLPQ